jgi:hypothetical protein
MGRGKPKREAARVTDPEELSNRVLYLVKEIEQLDLPKMSRAARCYEALWKRKIITRHSGRRPPKVTEEQYNEQVQAVLDEFGINPEEYQ